MKILCIHQGYELYGSDRSFIQSVAALRSKWPQAHITAYIPKQGPITEPLSAVATEVLVEDLWVPRKNALLRLFTFDAVRFPFSVLRAHKHMKNYNLTYINTMTIVNYNIAARFSNLPAIIHVREIVNREASMVFSAILRFSKAGIIFNSQATANAYHLHKNQLQSVVHNGIASTSKIAPPAVSDKLNLLMLGRFNSWKGQDLLVDAVAQLSEHDRKRLKVRIVGGVFEGQEHFIESIRTKIAKHALQDSIEILPFTEDTSELFIWSDVVVVPSRKPEPFGRVAIEAMAYSRPVIAADHGGLSEIIEDGDSGWLFEPNNAAECADILSHLICDHEEVWRAGINARGRFDSHFSENTYQYGVVTMCEKGHYKHAA